MTAAKTEWVEWALSMVGFACAASWSAGEEAIHWKEHADRRNKLLLEIREHLERQAARCKELEEDAARYRWIKENADVIFEESVHWHLPGFSRHSIESCQPCRAELDAAIDAARSALSAPKEQG